MKKKLIASLAALILLTVLGPIPVGYYYVRNKVIAHHTSLIKADDNIAVKWFRWWPHAMQLGIYLANPGGAIHMPPNYSETLTSNLVLKSETWLAFDGPCRITTGTFSVTVASGSTNMTVSSPFNHGSNQAGSNLGCSFQGYTGAGAVFDLGDSSGFTYNVKIVGINVGMLSAQANAVAFKFTNVVQSVLDDSECEEGAVAGQVCLSSLGTGAFFSGLNRVMGFDCEAAIGATNNFCIKLNALSTDYTILGGHANVGGTPPNGSVCIDVNGASSGHHQVYGFDCDTANTAITVESTASSAIYAILNSDSGVINIANFAASTIGNVIVTNANLPFTDSGIAGSNSVINPARNSWRTDAWQWQVTSGHAAINDVVNNKTLFEVQAGNNTFLDADGVGSQILLNTQAGGSGGVAGGSGSALTWQFDANGTLHPIVAGAVGIGTAALPWSQVFLGAAATNNTKWQPVVTAARTLTSPDGNSSTVMPFSFTTTAATTDNVTVTGMTASGHCTLTPTNTAAAAGIASVFISAKAANQITVTHTATAAWTFDGLCTSN